VFYLLLLRAYLIAFRRFRVSGKRLLKVDHFILQLEGIREICYWEVLLNVATPLQGLLLDAQQIRSRRNVVSGKVML